VPVAYLAAGVPLIEHVGDLTRFKSVCPRLMVTKTLRAGHFSPLEAPHNAMIERFFTICIERQAHTDSWAA
jgi:hypothetical protein